VTETANEYLEDEQEIWVLDDLISLSTTDKPIKLIHVVNARFAFTENQLFVNGLTYDVDEGFSKSICDKSIDKKMNEKECDVLLELLNQGFVKIKPIRTQ